ncbi:hypothetical protein [Streptacidiphilus sp. MAP5-3]|uniref:hypothetical protein n=1 Tax=unclassified Streptacidiphilus TaxID=2643834 RepID=UPI003514D0FD
MRSVRVLAAAGLTAGLVALPVSSAFAATTTAPAGHHHPAAACVKAAKELDKAKDDLKKALKSDKDWAIAKAKREVARAWDRVQDACCLGHRDHRGHVQAGLGGTQSGTANGALAGGAAAVAAAGVGGTALVRRRNLGR